MITTNTSFWEKNSWLRYDIIIIGSGIVGLSTAISLLEKDPGLKIAVLERGVLPSGASTKNAGFACFGSPSELLSDIVATGEEETQALVERRWRGLEKLRSRLGDKTIDFQPLGGYEIFQSLSKIKTSEVEYLNELLYPIFSQRVFIIEDRLRATFGFKNVKLIVKNELEGQLDTGKMMYELLHLAGKLGVRIFNGITFNDFESEYDKIIINSTTHEGKAYDFTCTKLCICTNGFVKSHLPQLNIHPGRGVALITKPVLKLRFSGAFHYEEGFYYFRDVGKRVLLGGGRNLDFNGEQTTSEGVNPIILRKLEKDLREWILPDQRVEIEHCWSGIMGFGKTKKPTLKEIGKNVYVGAGMGGMGVALGSLAGEELAELVLK